MRGPQCLLILMLAAPLMGCGGGRMSESDRDAAIQERLQEMETIKNDPKMNPQVKHDMIERMQLEVDDLKNESTDTE